MGISLIASSIGQSATLKLNATAASMKAKGEPVIHLGGGEPKSKAPADAIAAATSLLSSGEVRYTPPDGKPVLKKAIVRYMGEFYNHSCEPGNIMVAGGAKQAIMVALQAILDPKDEVIFPAPYWVSYPEMVKLCGATPVHVMPEEGTFIPRFADIEQHVGQHTKAIMLNSPNNPSGAVYSQELIAEVVEFCEKKGLYLIMDDIYQRLVFDNELPPNPYDFAKENGENSKLIVINGVSKQYAMTGFRIGWSVASKQLTGVMSNIIGHQTSGSSVLGQDAAEAALTGSQSCVSSLVSTLKNSRDILVHELQGFDGVHLIPPDGTFYCFADFSHYGKDSVKLAQFILDKVQVVTVPGIEFGMDGYLRISYCGGVKDIQEGMARIKWCLDPNAPNELCINEHKFTRDWA